MPRPPLQSPRRTQAERRASTRTALLEATIDCLVTRGADGTTTAQIENMAGCSRGARLHHFPTKAELLEAAAAHLYRRMREHFESRIKAHMAATQRGDDRFGECFRLLWETFTDRRHAAALEFFMLARTDATFRTGFQQVERDHHANMSRRLSAYFPEVEALAPHVSKSAVMETIHATMQGLTLRSIVFGEDLTTKEVLATIDQMSRAFLREQLGPASSDDHSTPVRPGADLPEEAI